jgi:hypothetical protein
LCWDVVLGRGRHSSVVIRQSSVVVQWYISCFPAIGFNQPLIGIWI